MLKKQIKGGDMAQWVRVLTLQSMRVTSTHIKQLIVAGEEWRPEDHWGLVTDSIV